MTGKNINIYFKEEIFNLLKEQVPQGKISSFINDSIINTLLEKKNKKEELKKKKIIAYYQKLSADSKLQEELGDWEDLSLESLKDDVKK